MTTADTPFVHLTCTVRAFSELRALHGVDGRYSSMFHDGVYSILVTLTRKNLVALGLASRPAAYEA